MKLNAMMAAAAVSGALSASAQAPEQEVPPVSVRTEAPHWYEAGRHVPEPQEIVLGENAMIDQWPGMASLQVYQDQSVFHACGATMIAPFWALTAAHCVEGVIVEADEARAVQYVPDETGRALERFGPLQIAINAEFLGDVPTQSVFAVSDVVVHPDYDADRIEAGSDLALLKLATPWPGPVMQLDGVSAAIDPGDVVPLDPDRPAASDYSVFAAGYGKLGEMAEDDRRITRTGDMVSAPSLWLQEGMVPVIGARRCAAQIRARIDEWQLDYLDPDLFIDDATQLCAGDGEVDACQGDSGGPLVLRTLDGPVQIGLISWGLGCSREESPGVYMRTAPFGDWISQTINAGAEAD